MVIFPSQQAFELAEEVFADVARMADGYQGRMGTIWYWSLPEQVLAGFSLGYTASPERWDIIRGEAATMVAGVYARVDFPFLAYARNPKSPPYLRDLNGEAQWMHEMFFDLGAMLGEMAGWLRMLGARPLATLAELETPELTDLQARLVRHALEHLAGAFVLKDLHRAFKAEISMSRLSALAQAWEEKAWLSPAPRKVLAPLQRAIGYRPTEAPAREA